ncbi:uncharacterized protein L969DRAFT_104073 [Mixia osmundae IAM 14324]|uniref:Uncharacterized protein n=1 Tax=Mixia osmundae (strain CBS 9802 / IAM 14324 / JCM 22182 / KY 12970) TaxID=764103 RepID=G7E6P2_MIXOS|nr:uncharacterized protein L969DRAFT_104073 [Mixia osmundae IAM 14324]KEI39118.1 hypothetical protein L969DRAFT_104073 [Mixia osmundae IAM 14324]GAA98502.1 hypothetical protein E5Q_05188 [Mixia osmundae IAM 14324]
MWIDTISKDVICSAHSRTRLNAAHLALHVHTAINCLASFTLPGDHEPSFFEVFSGPVQTLFRARVRAISSDGIPSLTCLKEIDYPWSPDCLLVGSQMSPANIEYVMDASAIMEKHVQGTSAAIVAAVADCCDLKWEARILWYYSRDDFAATRPTFALRCTDAKKRYSSYYNLSCIAFFRQKVTFKCEMDEMGDTISTFVLYLQIRSCLMLLLLSSVLVGSAIASPKSTGQLCIGVQSCIVNCIGSYILRGADSPAAFEVLSAPDKTLFRGRVQLARDEESIVLGCHKQRDQPWGPDCKVIDVRSSPSTIEYIIDAETKFDKHVQGSSHAIVGAVYDCCDLKWEAQMTWDLTWGDFDATEPTLVLRCSNDRTRYSRSEGNKLGVDFSLQAVHRERLRLATMSQLEDFAEGCLRLGGCPHCMSALCAQKRDAHFSISFSGLIVAGTIPASSIDLQLYRRDNVSMRPDKHAVAPPRNLVELCIGVQSCIVNCFGEHIIPGTSAPSTFRVYAGPTKTLFRALLQNINGVPNAYCHQSKGQPWWPNCSLVGSDLSPSQTEYLVNATKTVDKFVQGSSDIIVTAISDCCELTWEAQMQWSPGRANDFTATEPTLSLRCTNLVTIPSTRSGTRCQDFFGLKTRFDCELDEDDDGCALSLEQRVSKGCRFRESASS